MSELSEDPAERARNYIASFEKAFQKLIPLREDSVVKGTNIVRISDTIGRYLRDARYYLERGRPTTSLASVAYAEGLLDALAFLELAKSKSTE